MALDEIQEFKTFEVLETLKIIVARFANAKTRGERQVSFVDEARLRQNALGV